MPDREKVIKGLEMCEKEGTAEEICYNCPYFGRQRDGATMCITGLMQDALALLREQEPVKPYDNPLGYYRCGNCGTHVHKYTEQDQYCPICGRKVKWEEGEVG